jgi:hypothetical protein
MDLQDQLDPGYWVSKHSGVLQLHQWGTDYYEGD